MSTGYTKLFSSLVHSTIWREADHVRLVWITMLAIVDRDGIVEASVPGLADAARVSLEQCEEALLKLSGPDKYSRSKEHEGRRIADAPGGWLLLNHRNYREKMSAEHQREKTAERTRKWRDGKSVTDRHEPSPIVTVTGNDAGDDMQKQIRSEAKADQNPHSPQGGGGASDGIPEPSEAGTPPKDAEEIAGIFEFWRKEYKHPNAKLDRKRRAKIRERLREGFTARELCFAIRGGKKDEFLMGKNDRAQVYDDISVLLRDAGKVEQLLALAGKCRGGGAATSEPTAQERALAAAEARRVAALNAQAMAELAGPVSGQPVALAELTAGVG